MWNVRASTRCRITLIFCLCCNHHNNFIGFNPVIACEGPSFTAQQHSIKSCKRFAAFFFPGKAVVLEKGCEIEFCLAWLNRLSRSFTFNTTISSTLCSVCNLLFENSVYQPWYSSMGPLGGTSEHSVNRLSCALCIFKQADGTGSIYSRFTTKCYVVRNRLPPGCYKRCCAATLIWFLKWGQNTLAASNGSLCIATLALSPVVNFLYLLEQTRTCASPYPDNSALINITIRW